MFKNFRLWVGLLLLLARLATLAAESEIPPGTLAELQQRLTAQLSNPRFVASLFGVKIVSLDTGKVLFEHDADKLFSPASNCKLYTTALALDRLGGDYRIKTSLLSNARPDRRGTLHGDLIVYGRGDPCINVRLSHSDIYEALEPLVAALTNAGVKRIRGDLIGDDSYIQGPPYGSGWAWDDMNNYYGAEVSALTLNDNTAQVRVTPGAKIGDPCGVELLPATRYLVISNRTQTAASGSRRRIELYRPIEENVVYVTGQMPLGETNLLDDVTMHNPAGWFVSVFREALARHGIKVTGKTRTTNWLDRQVRPLDWSKCVELSAVESLPMRDLVREIMKPSQNLYTDLILAHIGEVERAADPQAARASATSEDLGIKALHEFLDKVGVKPGDVEFEEGSGLSRNNLTTPNATIALLQYMSHHREAAAYLDAMPIAGVDGTLRNRMKNTPAAGNLRAKTGTLRWAISLSGHVKTAAGERLIFSMMLNRYVASDTEHSGRGEIDRMAAMLAGFTGRSE